MFTEKYDYRRALEDDIREYIETEVNLDEWRGRQDDLEEMLNDDLWTDDSVTGNASGSYFFNAWRAEEALCHNLDLLEEACFEFGCHAEEYLGSPESADVTIRCYLLGECIGSVLSEFEGDLEEVEDLDQLVIYSDTGETMTKEDLFNEWDSWKDDEALEEYRHSFNDWYYNQILIGEIIEIDEDDLEEEETEPTKYLDTDFDCIRTRSELLNIYTLAERYNDNPPSFSQWLKYKVQFGDYVPIPNELNPLENMPWKCLEFANGANPYICWNREEWKKLNRKYYIKPCPGNPEVEGEGTAFYTVVKTWREVYEDRIRANAAEHRKQLDIIVGYKTRKGAH